MSTRLFSTYSSEAALVVAPLEPIGSLNAAEVRREAEGLMAEVHAQGSTKVIFEMSRADYFGSQAIELMILVWRYLAPAHGTMILCQLSPAAKEMLQVVGLNALWPVCDTLDEALAAPAQGGDN